MDAILQSYIKNLVFQQLEESPNGERIIKCVQSFQTLQELVFNLMDNKEEMDLTGVKICTILTFSILRKIADGKNPAQFDLNDWKDIAEAVSVMAIRADGREYTIFIFALYERYICYSIESLKEIVPPEKIEELNHIVEELQKKERELQQGRISEVAYTESCLWICLEAMIKLLACLVYLCGDKDIAEFTQALASCAFEYARFMLYKKEQALLTELLQQQYELDAQLEKKFEEFKEELEAETEEFYTLIDHAFSPDFRETFLQSILLARASGVNEGEILHSEEEIDDFFLL